MAETAVADIDIRIEDPEEMARVDAAFDAVESTDPRVSIMVDRGWNRPPMRVMSSSTPDAIPLYTAITAGTLARLAEGFAPATE